MGTAAAATCSCPSCQQLLKEKQQLLKEKQELRENLDGKCNQLAAAQLEVAGLRAQLTQQSPSSPGARGAHALYGGGCACRPTGRATPTQSPLH